MTPGSKTDSKIEYPAEPFLIGIAGGTGSGKTTLTENIVAALKREQASILRADWYYRDQAEVPIADRPKRNYDHPEAIETELLMKHLKALQKGRPAETPRYNFVTHTRMTVTQRIEPAPVIITEGILIFVDEKLRDLFDLKIFVETESDLRVLRRLRRDVAERGRAFESSVAQYLETVRPMHEMFVEPSKQHADIIVPASRSNDKAIKMIVDMIQQKNHRFKKT